MTFGVFDISVVELCLVGVLVLAFAYEVYFYVRYMRIRQQSDVSSQPSEVSSQPGVSVLVCARNEGYNLKAYVQSLLTQDYPTPLVLLSLRAFALSTICSAESNTAEVSLFFFL